MDKTQEVGMFMSYVNSIAEDNKELKSLKAKHKEHEEFMVFLIREQGMEWMEEVMYKFDSRPEANK